MQKWMTLENCKNQLEDQRMTQKLHIETNSNTESDRKSFIIRDRILQQKYSSFQLKMMVVCCAVLEDGGQELFAHCFTLLN